MLYTDKTSQAAHRTPAQRTTPDHYPQTETPADNQHHQQFHQILSEQSGTRFNMGTEDEPQSALRYGNPARKPGARGMPDTGIRSQHDEARSTPLHRGASITRSYGIRWSTTDTSPAVNVPEAVQGLARQQICGGVRINGWGRGSCHKEACCVDVPDCLGETPDGLVN